MKRTLSTYDVAHELLADEYASWTYRGAFTLAEVLEEYEEASGEELELDVVAIRCDYNEDTAEELFSNYGHEGETIFQLIERMNDETEFYIIADNEPVTYLYQAF